MGDVSNADTRPLPYPLYDTLQPIGYNIPNDDIQQIEWPDIPNDERIAVTIQVSLDEYVALASVIDVGRDIAYGVDSELIWWIWNRALIMNICEQIADCIENNETTQQAIATAISNSLVIQQAIGDYIKGSGLNSPQGQIDVNSDTVDSVGATPIDDVIGTIDDCNNDKLWGALRYGVVEYLEDNARNFLEDLNTIADKGQRLSNLVSGIPLVGDVLSATMKGFVEAVPDLLNLFDSYASETVQDNIACELFEIGCEECRLPTYGELIGYYSALGVTGYDDLTDIAFQLATDLLVGSSTLTGAIVYHTLIAYELMVLYFGSKFNQAIGIKIIDTWALLGEDFGNDNWELLCDGCGTDEIEIEIGTFGCSGLNAAAGTVTKTSLNTYLIESGHRTVPDEACYFRRVGGGSFIITSSVKVSGANVTNRGVCLDNVIVLIGSGGIPLNVCGDAFVVTAPNGQSFSYTITLGECP